VSLLHVSNSAVNKQVSIKLMLKSWDRTWEQKNSHKFLEFWGSSEANTQRERKTLPCSHLISNQLKVGQNVLYG